MNHPVVEVTDEAARTIFLVSAVILLMLWLMPYFGNHRAVAVSSDPVENFASVEYEPLLADEMYYYSEVAGASTVNVPVASAPQWYFATAAVTESLGDSYDEVVAEPFAEAAAEILDVSAPVREMIQYYQPGVAAVKDAWLELMTDPAY